MPLFHAPPNLNFTQRTAHGNLPEGDDTGLDLDEDGSQRGVQVGGGKVRRGIGIWRNSWHRNIPGIECSVGKQVCVHVSNWVFTGIFMLSL